MSNKFTVYMHVCPNGKRYIGITRKPVEKRWVNGLGYINNKIFFEDIQKYGWHNIEHKILYTDLQKEDAERKEISLIAEFNTANCDCGYNSNKGGSYGNRKQENELIPITVMLSPQEITELEKLAEQEKRSKSSILRISFLNYLTTEVKQ